MWSGKGLDAGELRVLAPIGILDIGRERRKRPEEASGLGKKYRDQRNICVRGKSLSKGGLSEVR